MIRLNGNSRCFALFFSGGISIGMLNERSERFDFLFLKSKCEEILIVKVLARK